MDGSRFDAWTRRGFGVAAGGLAGSLLALSAIPAVKAKKKGKKKKKDRCKELNDSCTPNGNKRCCGCLSCHPLNAVATSGRHCCHLNGEPCTAANGAEKCCSGFCTITAPATTGYCICKTNGQACSAGKQCCSGNCEASKCEPEENDN